LATIAYFPRYLALKLPTHRQTDTHRQSHKQTSRLTIIRVA